MKQSLLLLFSIILHHSLASFDDRNNRTPKAPLFTTLDKRAFLPNGPTFLNFPNIDYLNAATIGVLDAWRLTYQGLLQSSAQPFSSSFNRYFQPDDLCDLRKALQAVHGGQPGLVLPAIVKDKLTIAFDRPTWDGFDDECAADGTEMSYINSYGDYAQIVICRRAFHKPRISLDQIPCSVIGDSASVTTMETIGTQVLHELLHWRALIDVELGFHIGDWDPDSVEDDDHVPPDGYDPYNAFLLNQRGKPSDQNSDSYVWFATEVYFAVKCSRLTGFKDPVP